MNVADMLSGDSLDFIDVLCKCDLNIDYCSPCVEYQNMQLTWGRQFIEMHSPDCFYCPGGEEEI
jgi:hypothetical protein